MPGIFISYRRDDSFYSVRLLYEHLQRWHPNEDIFLDEPDIQAGAEWRATLAEKLEHADTVLVVIGRQWLSITNPATQARRLDEADDVVRWEVSEALRGKKRVIPVLIDGATLPPEAELPPDLRPLAKLQHRAIGRQSFEGDVQALARALSQEGAAIDPARWIWLVKRASLIVPVLVLALLALGRTHLLAQADVWFHNRITWVGDTLFDIHLDDRLRIVVIPAPKAGPPESGPNALRRAEMAHLLGELAALRPQSVVFDATFEGTTEADDRLAAAVTAAADRMKVRTVLGFKDLDADGRPLMSPRLRDSGAELGIVCVGDRRGGGNNVAFATLALLRDARAYPSLPLLGVFGAQGVSLAGLRASSTEIQLTAEEAIAISLTQTFDVQSPLCPARGPKTSMARFVPHLSNRDTLRSPPVRLSLEQIRERVSRSENPLAGKVVLVGIEQARDLLYTPLDLAEPRYGFEFQADAMNALLVRRVVRPLRAMGDAFSIALMAALAATIRLARLGTSRLRLRGSALSSLASYLAASVVAYRRFDVLWHPALPALAFLITWFTLSRLERR